MYIDGDTHYWPLRFIDKVKHPGRGHLEVVEDKGSFRYAQKTNAFGGSIGVARKMGNRLYWNVFELGAKAFTDNIFWSNMNFMFDIKMGVTYNLGKKK